MHSSISLKQRNFFSFKIILFWINCKEFDFPAQIPVYPSSRGRYIPFLHSTSKLASKENNHLKVIATVLVMVSLENVQRRWDKDTTGRRCLSRTRILVTSLRGASPEAGERMISPNFCWTLYILNCVLSIILICVTGLNAFNIPVCSWFRMTPIPFTIYAQINILLIQAKGSVYIFL